MMTNNDQIELSVWKRENGRLSLTRWPDRLPSSATIDTLICIWTIYSTCKVLLMLKVSLIFNIKTKTPIVVVNSTFPFWFPITDLWIVRFKNGVNFHFVYLVGSSRDVISRSVDIVLVNITAFSNGRNHFISVLLFQNYLLPGVRN